MLTYFILVEVLLVQEIILEYCGFDEVIGTLEKHEFHRFDQQASLVGRETTGTFEFGQFVDGEDGFILSESNGMDGLSDERSAVPVVRLSRRCVEGASCISLRPTH